MFFCLRIFHVYEYIFMHGVIIHIIHIIMGIVLDTLRIRYGVVCPMILSIFRWHLASSNKGAKKQWTQWKFNHLWYAFRLHNVIKWIHGKFVICCIYCCFLFRCFHFKKKIYGKKTWHIWYIPITKSHAVKSNKNPIMHLHTRIKWCAASITAIINRRRSVSLHHLELDCSFWFFSL